MDIGIDIGGTFTDIVTIERGKFRSYKLPSNPQEPWRGVIDGLRSIIQQGEIVPREVSRIAHGSTVATNALLEGKWAKTALITTNGFRDVLEIGRQNRPSLYDLSFNRPTPIVPRDLRFELDERIDYQGKELRPVDKAELLELTERLREAGIAAIAISFLFSFLNTDHEREVGEILERELGLPVTLSCKILPEFREYERTSTTVINASLRPVVGEYLGALESRSGGLGISVNWQIMQSNGTIMRAENAGEEPARIILSGPAAGVEGARAIAQLTGTSNVITMDMGGTSCDVSLIQAGKINYTTTGAIDNRPVALPMADINTIGAGGGSIAWIDSGGALRVGPHSAGASPGPACYGRGGIEPTVTDAHLILGHLSPAYPLGGLERLDIKAAREAIGKLADLLGRSLEEVALGILEVADAAMERAIRVISIERGHDPRDFSLVAFGGAGPLHAVSIARRLSIPRVIVPTAAGVLSAFGLLAAEPGRDYSQGLIRPIHELDPTTIDNVFARLRQRGQSELAADGVDPDRVLFQPAVDLRYKGQAHEITIPVSAERIDSGCLVDLETMFHREHRHRYGHAIEDGAIELVALRVRAIGHMEKITPPVKTGEKKPDFTTERVWFTKDWPAETRFTFRETLPANYRLIGPMVVLGEDATILIPPEITGRIDDYGNLVLESS
jgi:N-methylhydantoinase A